MQVRLQLSIQLRLLYKQRAADFSATLKTDKATLKQLVDDRPGIEADLTAARSALETMVAAKRKLEEEERMEKVFEIYIKTSPERLWEAITDPELRSQYSFGVRTESDWHSGSGYEAVHPGASIKIAEGENLEVDPPHRLVQSFNALWSDAVKAEGTSRVTWEVEPIGDDSCRLTVTHDQLREGANDELYGGWPMILSGLKTLLETGEKLTTPGSLMYSEASAWTG